MLVQNKIAFSFNGDLFAYSEEDGCLKIWQTSTGILKKDCFLDFNVYGTCSYLNWSLTDVAQSQRQIRIQKNAISFKNQLLAIGTTQGEIILYDFAVGKLCKYFEKAHSGIVYDLCWYLKTNSLFSCSSDHSLAVYDLTTGKIKLKWKAADQPITSICVIDDNNILSSSGSIHWWNISEKSLIKEFKGHATDVFKLLLVDVQGTYSSSCYFLSAAVGDIKLNVWHLDEKNTKSALASFVLSSSAEHVDMSKCLSKNKYILLSAVTEEGLVQLFEHMLNGVIKKPLLPKMSIHIVSKPNGRDSKPQTIPIIASKVCDDTGFCIVVYGCRKKPIFEKVNISECPKNLTLVRNKCLCCNDCSRRNLEVCSLIENGFKNKDVSPLNGSFKSRKQKLLDSEKKYTHVTEDGYTEQTEALKTNKAEARLPNLPSNMKKRLKIAEDELEGKRIIFSGTENYIHAKEEVSSIAQNLSVSALHQSLSSENEAMLNSIFQCTDEEKIKNLTGNLSIEDVAAILKELHSRLLQNQRHLPGVRKWIKNILAVHLLHLNANIDLADILHSIKQLTDARKTSETISKMATLRGLLRICQTKAISQELNFSNDVEDMES